MKLISVLTTLIISLFVTSCASNKRSEGKSISQISNEDFLKDRPIAYSTYNDYYDLEELEALKRDDSLVEETIQRVPEPKLEEIAEKQRTSSDTSSFMSLCYQKDFKAAFIKIDNIYQKYKKHPGYWNQVGSCYYLNNDYRKARLFYQKAIELKKNYAPAFNNIGAIHLKKKEYEKALAAFKKASELNPKSLTPLYNLAQVYLNFGVIDQAQNYFQRIERSKGGDHAVLNGLAISYLFQGKVKTALSYYEQIDPKNFIKPEYGVNYAVVLKLSGNAGRARDIIAQVDVTDQWKNYYQKVREFVR